VGSLILLNRLKERLKEIVLSASQPEVITRSDLSAFSVQETNE